MNNKIIIRIYKISKKMKQKYDLICNYRMIYYDYINKKITSCGIYDGDLKENRQKTLLNNKHKFINITNLPRF